MIDNKLMTELEQQALTGISQIGIYGYNVLEVQPLSNSYFAGTPDMASELSTRKEYEVVMNGYDEDLNGEVLTIMDENGQYRDLEPGQYKVTKRLSWNPDTDQLVSLKVEE